MATISEGSDVHTLIVVFTVERTRQDALVEHLRGLVAEHSQFDGFVSCSIHRSEDGRWASTYCAPPFGDIGVGGCVTRAAAGMDSIRVSNPPQPEES